MTHPSDTGTLKLCEVSKNSADSKIKLLFCIGVLRIIFVGTVRRSGICTVLLQGADEQEEEAQKDQEEVDDLALEVLLMEEQSAAEEADDYA